MKRKVIFILATTLTLSGCSFLKRFEKEKQVAAEPVNYVFLTPRRQPLDDVTANRLDNSNNARHDGFQYYSASGHRCKTLSISPIKPACNVSGKWLLASPILMNNSVK